MCAPPKENKAWSYLWCRWRHQRARAALKVPENLRHTLGWIQEALKVTIHISVADILANAHWTFPPLLLHTPRCKGSRARVWAFLCPLSSPQPLVPALVRLMSFHIVPVCISLWVNCLSISTCFFFFKYILKMYMYIIKIYKLYLQYISESC